MTVPPRAIQPSRRETELRGSFWRRFAVLALCLTVIGDPARAVSLINGSILTLDGLKLTVSGCSLMLAGVTQSSCAAGNLALQALTFASGASYIIAGSGAGANGTNIFSAAVSDQEYKLLFTLAVAASVPGSKTTVSSAALSTSGSGGDCYDGMFTAADQVFSAAAGNTMLMTSLASETTSGSFSPINSFSISNTFALEGDDLPGNGVLTLSSVRGTLNPALEPASVTLLLTGFVGVLITRRWRRSCAGGGVAGGIPG